MISLFKPHHKPHYKPQQKRRKISLTAVFTGFVSLSVLLTLTVSILSSTQTQKRSLVHNTLTLNLSTAVQMSKTMDSLFQFMQSGLTNAAVTFGESGVSLQKKELESRLDLIRNSSGYFNSIVLVDETGLVRAISPKSIGTAGSHITSQAALTALRSRKAFISEVYMTSVTKRIIVFISEPIFDRNGNYKGFISGTIYLQDKNILNQIFGGQFEKNETSYFYIVDSKGQVLYHPDNNRIGKDISANLIVQQLEKGKSGKQQYINLDGVDSLAGYTRIPSTGWGIVVVSPTKMIYDQLYIHVVLLLLQMLLPLTVLIFIVVWTARQIANPFVFLTNLVQKFEQDGVELPKPRVHWNREADLLTRTVVRALHNFRRQNEQLTQEAMTDALTGLMNRRTFEDTIRSWIDQRMPFAILVLDIDKFKTINDTFGHQTGDAVLKQVAGIIRAGVTPQDVSSRFGGEEFVVLLRNHDRSEAFLRAEQIRKSVEQAVLVADHPVTISIGVALYPQHSSTATELFHLADNALYLAKESGRNRTVMIQEQDKA
ncbi:sensor domain-containing diguanylate cyclase [Paenibacillus sanfengchensis]|uniref:sensor domain-containing diguanylate cyclase n=1 Tax=Paenibacillus sanfengchensis TaxID=3119819 RepID=UPI002FE32C17